MAEYKDDCGDGAGREDTRKAAALRVDVIRKR